MRQHFCDWLYQSRVEKGMSRRELARKSGVSPYMISRYEEECTPKIQLIIKFAKIFNESPDFMFNLIYPG